MCLWNFVRFILIIYFQSNFCDQYLNNFSMSIIQCFNFVIFFLSNFSLVINCIFFSFCIQFEQITSHFTLKTSLKNLTQSPHYLVWKTILYYYRRNVLKISISKEKFKFTP